MSSTSRRITAVLLVVVVVVFCLWRVASETYDRHRENVYNLGKTHTWTTLKTVGDYRDEGALSVYSGRDIIEFFRLQIPINPYIYTQAEQMDIRPERSYVITDRRRVFQILHNHLDQATIYEDARNIVYEGVNLPNAHVFESGAPVSDLLATPLPGLKTVSDTRFIHIRNQREWDAFLAMDTVPNSVPILVAGGIDLGGIDSDRLDKMGPLRVIGRDVVRLGPRDPFPNSSQSVLVEIVPPMAFDGWVPPVPGWFQHLAMLVLACLILFLGPRTLPWIGWFIVLVTSFTVPGLSTPFAVGWLGGGMLELGLRDREESVIWLMLLPLLTFGLGYQSGTVVPFLESLSLVVAGLVGVPLLGRIRAIFSDRYPLLVQDLLAGGLLVAVVYYVHATSPFDVEVGATAVPELGALAVGTLVVAVVSQWFGPADRRRLAWFPTLLLWPLLLLYPGTLLYLVAWPAVVWLQYSRKETSESRIGQGVQPNE